VTAHPRILARAYSVAMADPTGEKAARLLAELIEARETDRLVTRLLEGRAKRDWLLGRGRYA
jgi:hypothetical protein